MKNCLKKRFLISLFVCLDFFSPATRLLKKEERKSDSRSCTGS